MKYVSLFLAFFLLAPQSIFSQTSNADFNPEVKRVAVFKNGYAFTYREGEAVIKDGWTYTKRAPIGVLGTIWGYSTAPNVKVRQLLASETESEETERVENLTEFLISNEGARARFEVSGSDGKPKIYEGTYEIISRYRDFKNIPSATTDPNGYNNYQSLMYNYGQMLTVAVKTDTGTLAFSGNRITSVEVLGQPKYQKPASGKSTKLGIQTEGAKDGQRINLGVAALERGIRWIPAYRVEVKGDPIKEAKIELEANIINELTDLKDSEMYFVVGVPHFLFQDIASPLSINTAFAGVSSYFRVNGSRGASPAYSNAITTQVSSGYYSADAAQTSATPSPTIVENEQVSSFSAEQLFLYKTDKISLKKMERASLRLFSLTVPCSEIFEWTINDAADTQNRYVNSGYNQQPAQPAFQDLSSKVWYALKLKNTTGMPWTTAPALSFREWKPLGQDMLKFTPTGGEEILRVTPATEVIGTSNLVEKSRIKERMRWNGSEYDFDLVTIEGTLKLKNIKKQPVALSITRNLVGEVISATDNGEIFKEGLNLQAVNPNSTVKWNLTIPNGEKEIRYTYKIYVRK